MHTTGADHISMDWYKYRLQSYLCWVILHSGKLIHIYIIIRGENNLFFHLQLQPDSENISSKTLALKEYIHSLHRHRGKSFHLYLYQHVGLTLSLSHGSLNRWATASTSRSYSKITEVTPNQRSGWALTESRDRELGAYSWLIFPDGSRSHIPGTEGQRGG